MQQAHEIARNNLINKKQDNKRYYEKKNLIMKQHKNNTLGLNWSGPYEVIMVHNNENITIKKGPFPQPPTISKYDFFYHLFVPGCIGL